MKIWKISQCVVEGSDTYDSAIVAAETEDDARSIHPDGRSIERWKSNPFQSDTWVKFAARETCVFAELVGEATSGIEACVLLASFNAG